MAAFDPKLTAAPRSQSRSSRKGLIRSCLYRIVGLFVERSIRSVYASKVLAS